VSTTVAKRSWPEAAEPFDRLHMDYGGPVEGFYFLIVVDAATNFPFVFKTETQDAQETLSRLREVFGLFGLPRAVVMDNGPCFRAEVFNSYFSRRGVQVWHTPVAHPKSNGLVERFVGNLKLHLKITEGKGDLDSRLHSFLLQYRCAGVHSGKSPAERLLGFTPRLPSIMANPGDPVLYQRFQAGSSTFEPGVVLSTTGQTCVNIHDEARDTVHTRHREQVKFARARLATELPTEMLEEGLEFGRPGV
jgi:transposase InsO family protein